MNNYNVQKNKARNNYRAFIRYDDKRLTKTFKTKTEAVAWARKTIADLEDNNYRVDATNFGQVIDQYFELIDPIKPIGQSKRVSINTVKKHLGHYQLKDSDQKVLQQFIIHRRKNDGVAASTARQDISYIGTVYKAAEALMNLKPRVAEHKAAMEYLKSLDVIAQSDERDRRVSDEEIALIVDDYEGGKGRMPLADWIEFAVNTAMRMGEIASLRWDDLSKDGTSIIIRQRKHPKKKRDQKVPLLPAARKVIARQERKGSKIFKDSPESIGQMFKKSADKAGIEDVRFHDLRHEGTSRLFDHGFDSMVVAVFTGHRDVNMLRRYTHMNAQRILEMAEQPRRVEPPLLVAV